MRKVSSVLDWDREFDGGIYLAICFGIECDVVNDLGRCISGQSVQPNQTKGKQKQATIFFMKHIFIGAIKN
jgi:hypothetical protein